MEISLLTGVPLILTIFDQEEGKVIQYLSDSMERFQAINTLREVDLRKKKGDDDPDNKEAKYVTQNIISEIYTNDHVS